MKHVLESPIIRLEKFRLYKTSTTYYLVGFNELETAYRLVKINRTIPFPKDLAEILREDPLIYTGKELEDILDMIHEGNKTSGGLVKIATACGIVGFVKFLNGYYLTLITQRKEVGCIAGNFIYTIKATEMFAIKPRPEPESNALKNFWKSLNKRLTPTTSEVAENRYLGLFQFVDMTKDFFFSYSNDLTHSLQYNYIAAKNSDSPSPLEMYEWNYYQINEFRNILGPVAALQWTVPIIHGSYQQKRFSQLGSTLDLVVIARRSRHYAGTRYLKRGLNVSGKVANDCEVEQILQYDEGGELKFCSYVQMRGSIPTYWHQETSVTMPKPPILINRVDPDYLATQAHFADMFRRYGSPVIVLDLVKQHEKKPRESIVGREFRNAIEILNESITLEHKIRYLALDYSKITSISKGKFSKVSKGKASQGPFLSGGKADDIKERATAAIGDEWTLMENSMKRETVEAPDQRNTEGNASLTKFDNATRKNANLPGGLPSSAGRSPYDVIDDVVAVESRIDVLKELEDIASLTIQETGFFCNSTRFMDRLENVVGPAGLRGAYENNIVLQSGVLRTNCIDCLDRTNGGQFAVGLYFLSISLYSLGLRTTYSKNIEIHKDPLLLMLMEMYGEMADKIALQYGGSEAHKKVLAGKSVPSSNSKQNELLTSIKRYYSNAFTDMVKQDAMNVFLGCFTPSESNIPLWDLDSDYHLHNLSLHPPIPPIYRTLYNDLVTDSNKLKEGSVRSKVDNIMKKIAQAAVKKLMAQAPSAAIASESSSKSDAKDQSVVKSEEEEELDIDGVKVSSSECETFIRRYYVKAMGTLHGTPDQSTVTKGTKKKKNALNYMINSLTRMERRRLLRLIVSNKVSKTAQLWWKSAMYDYSMANTIRYDANAKAQAIEESEDQLPLETYFTRYYQPHKITEFDSLLSMDFFAVTELSQTVTNPNANVSVGAGGAGAGPDVTILSSIFYYPNLLTSAVVGGENYKKDTADTSNIEGKEEIAEAVAQVMQQSRSTYSAVPAATSQLQDDEQLHNSNDMVANSGSNVPTTPNNISTIGRYVRDLGMKARNIVGGFLRKDDSQNANMGNMRRSISSTIYSNRNANNSWITEQDIYVSKSSIQLYSIYEAIYNDNTLLFNTANGYSHHNSSIYDTNAVKEEYRGILKEFIVPTDDVNGMEQLAKDSYVCSEINTGIFAGLPQNYSANLAYLFLLSAVDQMNNDLSSFGDYIDYHYNLHYHNGYASYAVSSLERGHSAHSTVHSNNLEAANLHNLQLPLNTATATTTSPTPLTVIGDYSKRRDIMARNISLRITNKLADRMKDYIAKQNAFHFSNFQNFFYSYDFQSMRNTKVPSKGDAIQVPQVAQGLENELRKIINNNIFQQYQYNKDISLDRLAQRLSSNCTESNVLNYMHQFDSDVLASDYDNLLYIMKDSGNYYTSFKEVKVLQRKLEPMIKQLQNKKKSLLDDNKQGGEDNREEVKKVRTPKTAAKPKTESVKKRRQSLSYRKQRLAELLEEQDAVMKQANKSKNLLASAADKDVTSLSAQLGIFSSILEEDLKTDFSLNLYTSSAMQIEESVGYAYASFPYNEDTFTLADHDYTGFVQLGPDLYSRSTNPHLQLNEIGVMRFQDALKRQELAQIDESVW